MTDWTTTVSTSELAEWIGSDGPVAIVTHARPDGDAIGSSFALCRAINKAAGSRRAKVFLTGGLPRWFNALAADTPHQHTADTPPDPAEYHRVIVVDTGSWSQLDDLADFVRGAHDRTAIIDHHLRGNPEMAERRILATTAAAACEPIAELCAAILGLNSPAGLPKDIAKFVYLGLATDTGWFRHSNVKPGTLRLAADLIEAGVAHAELFSTVEQSEKPARLKIIAAVLASLELIDRDRIAIMTLRTEDIHAAHAGPEDTGGLADHGLRIQTVRVSATVTQVETADGQEHAKISMRSKPGTNMIDVNEIAAKLGGGGHANAAGAKLACSVDQAKAKLIEALTR